MKTYLVGGAIRDRLLGFQPKERDWVVVGSSPQEMKSKGFRQVGKDFPVFIHPQTGEEYALVQGQRENLDTVTLVLSLILIQMLP